jgi:hypothetical protein
MTIFELLTNNKYKRFKNNFVLFVDIYWLSVNNNKNILKINSISEIAAALCTSGARFV